MLRKSEFIVGSLLSRRAATLLLVVAATLRAEMNEQGPTESPMPALPPKKESPGMPERVPKEVLEPVLKKAAALANVAQEQLVIARAEPAVWNDGSLGCPEPGIQYTQALVNGYWVVITAAGQTYDFRLGRGGDFRLCPPGRGHPPLPSSAAEY